MKCKYPGHDLNQRLNASFVMYDGTPCYVVIGNDYSEEDYTMRLYDSTKAELEHDELGEPLRTITDYDPSLMDENFDISSIELGYVNLDSKAKYLKRMPYQQWKQGISQYSVLVYEIGEKSYSYNSHVFSILKSVNFRNAVLGYFPSLSRVLKDMKSEKYYSQAISKDVAISKTSDDTCEVYLKNCLVADYKISSRQLIVRDSPEKPAFTRVLNRIDWKNVDD